VRRQKLRRGEILIKAAVLVGMAAVIRLAISMDDTLCAQTASTPPPANAATPTKTPAQAVGLYVYPTKEQDQAQQAQNEGECYTASKQQTGWDPAAPAPPAQAGDAPKGAP